MFLNSNRCFGSEKSYGAHTGSACPLESICFWLCSFDHVTACFAGLVWYLVMDLLGLPGLSLRQWAEDDAHACLMQMQAWPQVPVLLQVLLGHVWLLVRLCDPV